MQTKPLVSAAEELGREPPQNPRRAWRTAVLVAATIAAAVGTCSMSRIPQAMGYFAFADHRTLLGIPNALNVLSNVAFAVVGIAGLQLLVRQEVVLRDRRERWPWLVFFVGIALIGLGSAWFHLRPSKESLVWDRMPMAVAFMALFAALIAERIGPIAGLCLVGPMAIGGVASVLYWHLTELAGAGDLRPYYFVQFYPLLAIPLVLALFPPVYTGSSAFIGALVLYLLAKVVEVADAWVFALSGTAVSGHTLKHLLAAAGIFLLVWMLGRRRALPDPASVMLPSR